MVNEFNLEELDGLDLDSETHYEVWAIGYDRNNKPTEFDYLLDSFSDPDAAITFADSITVSEILEVAGDPLVQADHFSIEVETASVVDDEPMNLGTIYRRAIYYNSITADVYLLSGDYELLDDGTIKIKKHLLEDFKDKETINILFAEEKERSILPFKIVTEFDTSSYLCDMVF